MKINKLTFLGFDLNTAIESGNFNYSKNQIKEHLAKNTLFTFLEKELGVDISIFSQDEKDEINQFLYDLTCNDYEIKNNGLSLLLAYILEYIKKIASKK